MLRAGGRHCVHLSKGDGQRFLAEHVLARLHGFDAPFGVQAVGQRDVDDVDVRVGQHRLIAAEGVRDVPFGRVSLGVRQIAAGDGGQPVARRGAQRCDERSIDVGRAQQAPVENLISHQVTPHHGITA